MEPSAVTAPHPRASNPRIATSRSDAPEARLQVAASLSRIEAVRLRRSDSARTHLSIAAWLGPSKKSLRHDTDQRLLFSCSKQMRRWRGRGLLGSVWAPRPGWPGASRIAVSRFAWPSCQAPLGRRRARDSRCKTTRKRWLCWRCGPCGFSDGTTASVGDWCAGSGDCGPPVPRNASRTL